MPTSRADVAHLLRRAGFGGSRSEIDSLVGLDLPTVVDRVLSTAGAGTMRIPRRLDDPTADSWDQFTALAWWWFDRMATSPTPIVEKMALFWHGHFCSAVDKVKDQRSMAHQNVLFRRLGMGGFRDLCQAVAVDPAMLMYLDNADNLVGAANENFAREFMELFSLGVNQYSQDDVVAAARAWTGHGLSAVANRYQVHPADHDDGQKTFFGETRNWDGPAVIDKILATKQATAARFLVTKLWSFFAYPDPEVEIVDALSQAFVGTDLNIASLLRAIFLRPEFYSAQAREGLIRTPIEYVVATMRASGMPASVLHPEWFLDAMGQQPYNPPNVAGWHSNGYWLSASTVWAKANFAQFAAWKATEVGFLDAVIDLSPQNAVSLVLDAFGVDRVSPQTRSVLDAWALAQTSAASWAVHGNLILLVLMTPDFQLA